MAITINHANLNLDSDWSIFNTTSCDKVCQWLAISQWLSPGTPVSSTNKRWSMSREIYSTFDHKLHIFIWLSVLQTCYVMLLVVHKKGYLCSVIWVQFVIQCVRPYDNKQGIRGKWFIFVFQNRPIRALYLLIGYSILVCRLCEYKYKNLSVDYKVIIVD
jgi:hypothetical protein